MNKLLRLVIIERRTDIQLILSYRSLQLTLSSQPRVTM